MGREDGQGAWRERKEVLLEVPASPHHLLGFVLRELWLCACERSPGLKQVHLSCRLDRARVPPISWRAAISKRAGMPTFVK